MSLREKIFREVVANLLVHREYTKNPMLSKFFWQLGRVEEIGSGILNVSRYLKHYVPGAIPQFIEGHPFQTIIPLIGKKAARKARLLHSVKSLFV